MRLLIVLVAFIGIGVGLFCGNLPAHDEKKEVMEATLRLPDKLVWQDGPASLPSGAKRLFWKAIPQRLDRLCSG